MFGCVFHININEFCPWVVMFCMGDLTRNHIFNNTFRRVLIGLVYAKEILNIPAFLKFPKSGWPYNTEKYYDTYYRTVLWEISSILKNHVKNHTLLQIYLHFFHVLTTWKRLKTITSLLERSSNYTWPNVTVVGYELAMIISHTQCFTEKIDSQLGHLRTFENKIDSFVKG